MNRKYYLPALAALSVTALVSCTGDGDYEPVGTGTGTITFRTVLSNSLSRSNVLTADALREFDVVCFDSGDSHYFGPLSVSRTEAGGDWTYEGVYNWKGQGRHRFFAAARLGDAVLGESAGSTWPAVSGFTVSSGCYFDSEGAHGDGQYDLCTAFYEGTSGDGPVALTFQHQLARIDVRGINSTPNRRIEVMGVRIVGLDRTGSWHYDDSYISEASDGTRNGVRGRWITDGAGDGDFCIRLSPDQAPVTLTEGGVSLTGGESFMVFPTVDPDDPASSGTPAWDGSKGTYLSVICRVVLTDAAGHENVIIPASGDADRFGMAMVPLSFALEAGKKYTFSLDFSTGSGQVDPSVPSRDVPGSTEPGDTNDDINDDSGLLGPDDFYEGEPIRFQVTVAEWTEVPDGVDVEFTNRQ